MAIPTLKSPTFKPAAKSEKVSNFIIEQIRNSVLSGQLKAGDRLASEKELLNQFDVSKGSLREALRVLEVMGLIEMKKGVSGGVFVAEVDMKTTLNSIVNFLHFKSLSHNDITMVRLMLEPIAIKIVADCITPSEIDSLKHVIGNPTGKSDSISFHRHLIRFTRNPLLILIMDFVDNLLEDIKEQLGLGQDFYKKLELMHMDIIDALADGNGNAAAKAITNDLLWVDQYMSEKLNTTPFHPTFLALENNFPASDSIVINKLEGHLSSQCIEEIKKNGIIFEKLTSGELYLFLKKGGLS